MILLDLRNEALVDLNNPLDDLPTDSLNDLLKDLLNDF